MDIALTQRIVSAANTQAGRKTADALGIAVLKKALATQASAAATLLQALPQAQPALAATGTLGTQVNTYA
ncbi:MAG TPA: putative motility protein [Acidovorax sp.]|jgi:hypothetical protein|nr:putative motility protein [Acidovorax sp.]